MPNNVVRQMQKNMCSMISCISSSKHAKLICDIRSILILEDESKILGNLTTQQGSGSIQILVTVRVR